MIRQDVTRGQRIDDILALWAGQAKAGLPTLLELDPVGNVPTHVGWTLLLNRDGTCRLAGGDAETFLERDCKACSQRPSFVAGLAHWHLMLSVQPWAAADRMSVRFAVKGLTLRWPLRRMGPTVVNSLE